MLLMLVATGLVLFVFPRPDHAVARTGMALMVLGAVVASVGMVLDKRGRVTSRRQ
ncbi:hypothetical protein [Actinoplanes sp. N902-109]|uniref:hypothetical protein n=1 Tax=Actinoplanes sp. (strain N902-109) TaxID=649831 RepID=UPI0003295912|nr:hypothetical protein [Actinoplanes sp. N902-109]AGL15812.1 hypothetical protein L083_2302 [Actinoplanes sp. N902-109]